jgi:hypothetical protein
MKRRKKSFQTMHNKYIKNNELEDLIKVPGV